MVTPDGKKTLKIVATREEAIVARLQMSSLAEIAGFQTSRARWIWIALVAGFALGFGGSYAVWLRSRRTPETVAQARVARTFQNIRLFGKMTVLENVLIGLDRAKLAERNSFRSLLERNSFRSSKKDAWELLEFVGLTGQANQPAKDLPYGHQRRLEIARALATAPQLLLLDEPAAGTNPSESAALMELIQRIRSRAVTVLLIEHHMNVVMGISDRIAVLDHGVKIAQGTPEEIRNNPLVIEAYLGKEEAA